MTRQLVRFANSLIQNIKLAIQENHQRV